jgi:hypothetical protein
MLRWVAAVLSCTAMPAGWDAVTVCWAAVNLQGSKMKQLMHIKFVARLEYSVGVLKAASAWLLLLNFSCVVLQCDMNLHVKGFVGGYSMPCEAGCLLAAMRQRWAYLVHLVSRTSAVLAKISRLLPWTAACRCGLMLPHTVVGARPLHLHSHAALDSSLHWCVQAARAMHRA